MSCAPAPRAFYLGEHGEQVFALFHPAAAQVERRTSVLMCPPFGWEEVCSYRSRREWADQLAGAGHPTLRFDLPSTGDSGGSAQDDGRLEAWIAAVQSAAEWLSSQGEGRAVAAIGIGLGGMLACAAAANGAPLDELVLWAVPARGSALVRELRAFERMESVRFAGHRNGHARLPDGSLSAGGFMLSAETVRALERLDLAELALAPGAVRRALLIERDGIRVDESLRGWLESCGTAAQTSPGIGFTAMTAEPQEARPPSGVFALVGDWLGDDSQPPPVAARPGGGPAALGRAQLEHAGVRISERPISFEQSFGRLFGVLAEPLDSTAGDLGALFLNAGAIRRIGPNRMWVESARRWAARGIPSLRLDLEGLGDADGDASRFADVAELYVAEFVTQVRAVIGELEALGVARRFVLAGLCSGAYWSFHGALQDERVSAAFMVNPRTLFWSAPHENLRYVRRGLLKRSSWRMIANGDVSLARVGRVARQAPQSLVASALARWRTRGDADALELALDRLCDDGKQLAFLFSEEEPLQEELARQGRFGDDARWPNLRLELLPGSDHTLRPAWSQKRAHDALDGALGRELEKPRT